MGCKNIFKIVLFILLLRKIANNIITKSNAKKRKMLYFFICYTILSVLLNMVEYMNPVPKGISYVLIVALYLASLGDGKLAMRVAKLVVGRSIQQVVLFRKIKNIVLEELCILLLFVTIKIFDLIIILRFKVFFVYLWLLKKITKRSKSSHTIIAGKGSTTYARA
ncbi:hypothetical protein ENBRE01_0479 [Enteropsectra breve]|nr:hypothetical protein ENBRE01_0479 [Enteropsectra breve]